jgi:hypothetical protein
MMGDTCSACAERGWEGRCGEPKMQGEWDRRIYG